MPRPFKIDLHVDNFEKYFALKAQGMSESQKERLPVEISARVFKKGGRVSEALMPFLQQLYVLQKGLGSEIFIVIKDPDIGIGFSDFEKFQKQQNGSRTDITEAQHYLAAGVMVLGNKELMDWIAHLNFVSMSPYYNYIIKLKNSPYVKLPNHNEEVVRLCEMLSKYDGSKRKLLKDKNISVPEWYILMYLADGKQKGAVGAYRDTFSSAYNATRPQLHNAFKRLVSSGYIQSEGSAKKKSYKITAFGRTLIREIFHKYIIP